MISIIILALIFLWGGVLGYCIGRYDEIRRIEKYLKDGGEL